MRSRFEAPEIWPGFVDMFAGFALVVVATVLSAQITIDDQTRKRVDADHALDAEIKDYINQHRGRDDMWSTIECDTSSIGRAVISLPGKMTFDLGRSELKPEAKRTLEVLAGLLEHLKRRGAARAYVIGFSDTSRVLGTLPDGSTNNLELSSRRATNTAWFLTHERALSDTFVVVSAMGDKAPYLKGKAIDAAYSRRIEIAVHYQEQQWDRQ